MTLEQINEIRDLIADVHQNVCEGEASQYQLARLYDAITRLMDATFETKDQDMKVALATLECAARQQKELVEELLVVRN
ncbi:hypothetical protein ACFL3F_01750 [Planctomycetota bacterium]